MSKNKVLGNKESFARQLRQASGIEGHFTLKTLVHIWPRPLFLIKIKHKDSRNPLFRKVSTGSRVPLGWQVKGHVKGYWLCQISN